jgi:O-glycosyl hydrolase
MFMTEYYNQEGKDTTKDFWRLAWIMQEGFTRANLSMWIYWDMAWDHGSMVSLYNPSTAYPDTAPLGFRMQRTYYAQAQYSRFVKPTWLRVSALAGDTALKVVAFASKSGDSLALVIVNPYGTAVSTTPSITKTVTSAQVWTTDATHSLANTGNWATGQTLSVPAYSVTTIVMTLQASTGILNRATEETNASNPNGYMIYDLLGRPYMHVQNVSAQLPQGRWIVVPR